MRLIDADALLKDINDFPYGYRGMINDVVARQPTIEAVPTDFHDKCMQIEIKKRFEMEKVIRCKDCRHSEHWYGDKRRCFLWHETGIDVFEDAYCSYGKRREDG